MTDFTSGAHFVDGRQAAADPESVAHEFVAFLSAEAERVARIEEETGAPPEPGGYVRYRRWLVCAHAERDRLLARGVPRDEAHSRAVAVADVERAAQVRERALGRLGKVDVLAREAARLADAVRAGLAEGVKPDRLLPALDAAIVAHERIAGILRLDRTALGGGAERRAR